MCRSITVNGEDVSFRGNEFYRDSAFRKADIPSSLTQGINTIELALDYAAPVPDSLDALYTELVDAAVEMGLRDRPTGDGA